MLILQQEDNWFIATSKFIGGPGIFLIIAIILIVVVLYNKFLKKRR
jgi:hypothetical protein